MHFVFLLTDIAPSAFAEGAAAGTDVNVGLVDGRLVAALAGIDWLEARRSHLDALSGPMAARELWA